MFKLQLTQVVRLSFLRPPLPDKNLVLDKRTLCSYNKFIYAGKLGPCQIN